MRLELRIAHPLRELLGGVTRQGLPERRHLGHVSRPEDVSHPRLFEELLFPPKPQRVYLGHAGQRGLDFGPAPTARVVGRIEQHHVLELLENDDVRLPLLFTTSSANAGYVIDETWVGLLVDRESGRTTDEGVFAGGFLSWCYNSRSGLLFTNLLLRHRIVSELIAFYFRTGMSRGSIRRLVETGAVRLDELKRPLEEFRSFEEFFTRPINLECRPIDQRSEVCVSPVDGRVLAYRAIEPDASPRIKRAIFRLRDVVADDALTARLAGGPLLIFRLHMADYHHFHFPDSGVPEAAQDIAGTYWVVSPYPQKTLPTQPGRRAQSAMPAATAVMSRRA